MRRKERRCDPDVTPADCRADQKDFCLPEWVYKEIEAAGIRCSRRTVLRTRRRIGAIDAHRVPGSGATQIGWLGVTAVQVSELVFSA